MKVGDLVLAVPHTFDTPLGTDREPRGIVIQVFHEGSVNQALKVKLLNGDICVRPTDEWKKLS
jgi:hypothetical protein